MPGNDCPIDNAKDYYDGLNVHYASGVFNKAFYLIATSTIWNTKKTFEIMVHANQNYWTSNTSFADAACGVMKAAQDFKYDARSVEIAMKQAGIDTRRCPVES